VTRRHWDSHLQQRSLGSSSHISPAPQSHTYSRWGWGWGHIITEARHRLINRLHKRDPTCLDDKKIGETIPPGSGQAVGLGSQCTIPPSTRDCLPKLRLRSRPGRRSRQPT
jgi:hypothetical protein